MTDSRSSADWLVRNAVELLPAGALGDRLSAGGSLRVKLGIDPTAPDIHLGHAVVLRKLRELQDAGHRVVLIIGDFTARVGDPSGRSAQRPVLSPEEIEANAATFQEQAFKLLDPSRTEVRRNSEWLRMPLEDLFALMSHSTVARLLERDDFASRMEREEPVSVLELMYPLLQAYDSVAIRADLEIGGTDQKFNLLYGRELQAAYDQAPQVVMTLPILPGTDGEMRMSKSTGNYIGVTEPPEEMLGKVMSIPDTAMPEYFDLLLGSEPPPGLAPNLAKRDLARRIVAAFHDGAAADRAEAHFDRLFVRHELPEEVEEVHLEADGPVHVPALLADAFDLSRGEARRLIAQGGVKLDGEALPAEALDIPADRLGDRVISVGKRRHKRVRLPGSERA